MKNEEENIVELVQELEPVQSDPEAVARIGIRYAASQCRELLQRGAPRAELALAQLVLWCSDRPCSGQQATAIPVHRESLRRPLSSYSGQRTVVPLSCADLRQNPRHACPEGNPAARL